MKITNKKIRKFFWEVRRYAIILCFYAIVMLAIVLAVCFFLSLPETIGALIFRQSIGRGEKSPLYFLPILPMPKNRNF